MVSNGNQNVSVIDVSTNQEITTIPVGAGPVGIAITPDGAFAYVATSMSGSVSVIDLTTNQETTSIPVGNIPSSVAITPDGAFAYVTNNGENTVSVIDLSTNQEILTIEVGTDPSNITISSDGAFAYVTNFAEDTVSLIDLSTNQEISTIAVGDQPLGIEFGPLCLDLLGSTGIDLFLTQTDRFNIISWPPFDGPVTSYRIYRGADKAELIGAVLARATQFIDHNRKKGQRVTYVVEALNDNAVVATSTVSVTTN